MFCLNHGSVMHNEEVILSFTSLPKRINHIKPMINSVLEQSYKPDKICLWLPKISKRFDTEMTKEMVPGFIKDTGILVEFCEDLGPSTKLLPSLKAFSDPKTIIITADDDTVYPKDWIKRLVSAMNRFPNAAIAYRGRKLFRKSLPLPFGINIKRSLKYRWGDTILFSDEDRVENVDILTGVLGAAYRRSFFNDDVFSHLKCKSAFFNDDIWVSGNLAMNHIERKVIGIKAPFSDIPMEKKGIHRLWDTVNNGSGLNDKTIKYFKEFF